MNCVVECTPNEANIEWHPTPHLAQFYETNLAASQGTIVPWLKITILDQPLRLNEALKQSNLQHLLLPPWQ